MVGGGIQTPTDASTLPASLPPDEALDQRRGRWMLATVCLGPFVTQLATFALSPFLPFVAADLGTSVAVLGQVPALTMLVAALLGLVVGPLADRVGHRPTLIAGVIGSSVGALATALAPSLLVLAPAAVVGAVGRSIGLPVAQAVVGVRFAGPALRRGIGLIQATGTLAPIVGIPVATALGVVLGWRGAFLALGVLGLGAALLMLWHLPADRRDTRAARRVSLAAFRPIFADPPTLWLYGSTLGRNIGVWAFTTYLGAYLVEQHSLTGVQVGWAFTVTGLGNLAGSLATGGPLGRFRLTALAIAAPVLIGGCLGAVTILSPSLPLLVVLLVLGFVGNGVGIVSQNTLLVDGSPAGRATTTSLNQTCMSLGGAVGGSLGGLLIATGGFPALGVLTLVGNLAAAACLLPAHRADQPSQTDA